MFEYRAVRPIDPHNVVEEDGKPPKSCRGYKVGEVLEADIDLQVREALIARNLVVPVVVPDAKPQPVNVKPASVSA